MHFPCSGEEVPQNDTYIQYLSKRTQLLSTSGEESSIWTSEEKQAVSNTWLMKHWWSRQGIWSDQLGKHTVLIAHSDCLILSLHSVDKVEFLSVYCLVIEAMEVKCLLTGWWLKGLRGDKRARAELLTEGIRPAVKMNSQQNTVNDYRGLITHTVIDLRCAWLFMFIDAIVYLFGARRLLEFFGRSLEK